MSGELKGSINEVTKEFARGSKEKRDIPRNPPTDGDLTVSSAPFEMIQRKQKH
jgi:hypothetical protein